MIRTRPPIAMPAIAPTGILEYIEAAPVLDAEAVGDDIAEAVEADVAEDDDEGIATCAMRVGA
jgi:hypothetical protein